MRPIKFGTDGWRGVIADDFTFERAAVVFRAIGEYLLETGDASRGIALGFDNRFAAGDFAYLAACILTRQGIRVRLAAHSLPTPVISYVVRYEGLGGGVMITASHNPAAYSGIKFKSPSGASASPEETARFEARANALLAAGETGFPREPDAALLTQEDFIPPYLAHVKTFVDVDAIRAAAPRIMVDSLYGSSQGVLDRCLREVGCQVSVIHDERNPGFGGLHPEPIPHNIGPLREALGQTAVDGAVISDGDGDRLAAMTGDGFFLSPHYVFSLLLMHLVEDRHMTGTVVKTVSSTTMLDRLTQHYGLKLLRHPSASNTSRS
jgi:phosphomannomutase